MGETVPNQLVVTFHIRDNVEESANCGLGLFLVLTKYEKVKVNLRLAHRTSVSASRRWR